MTDDGNDQTPAGITVGPIQVRRVRPLRWRAKFRITRPGHDFEEIRLRGLTRRGVERKAERARHDIATSAETG